MIPIIYDKNETAFINNGFGRLRDCISCIVTEERNGIYELDMEYPVTGANYELIEIGRIIGATHDDSGDLQPFDIVSATRPIDGVVTFHAVHISYRQSYITVPGGDLHPVPTDINSSLGLLKTQGVPSNPFNYWTNITASGGAACYISGVPYSVRQILGGIEGSILDTYGGEYEFDKWTVKLWSARGQYRDFSIRYGVNMLEYEDQSDSADSYSSCVPYWTDGTDLVVASRTTSGASTITGRGECVPLDLSEKFDSKPTKTQLKNKAKSYMTSNNTYAATQTISVSFARLQDMGEYSAFQDLLRCGLCDTINVVFPDYKTQSPFKIVKTVWNVLSGKYDEMELGDLSISLSDALGITSTGERLITVPTKTSDLTNDSGFISADANGDVTLSGNITLRGHSSAVGDYHRLDATHSSFASGTSYAQLKDTSVSPNTNASFTLGRGMYVVVGEARFAANSSGYRGLEIHSSGGNVLASQVLVPPYSSSSVQTRIQTVCIIEVAYTTDTIDLYAVQNSGSALNVAWGFRAIRIR